jgi:hypothetical protein
MHTESVTTTSDYFVCVPAKIDIDTWMFVYLILLNRTKGSILLLNVHFYRSICRSVFRT